ncbi:hypothetical protein [Aeromicrobium sp. UC242_57]|uniref:hypothetical protein n=1 Tax=Aeromicrobium sp. UC242_57 TaxID=3374624 RepID=UPI0037BF6917
MWIGRGALVLPGVTIGKGSVIGSQAIVTKDVPPGSIVVGPAATVAGTVDGWETYRRPH